MSVRLTTEADLAAHVLLVDEKRAAELRLKNHWPHVRLGRFDVRYTDDQIEQIVAMHAVVPETVQTSGRRIAGQTARSAGRKKAS